jgi:hypothetical protein
LNFVTSQGGNISLRLRYITYILFVNNYFLQKLPASKIRFPGYARAGGTAPGQEEKGPEKVSKSLRFCLAGRAGP